MIYRASKRRPFPGRIVVDATGFVTDYANGLSCADLFSEEPQNIMQPGDVLPAALGSGNSHHLRQRDRVRDRRPVRLLGRQADGTRRDGDLVRSNDRLADTSTRLSACRDTDAVRRGGPAALN